MARFYRFCHSSRVLSPFAEQFHCGWFDGGCFVFARALQLWLGGRLAVIVREELFHGADHVVLSLSDPEGLADNLYLDADGVTTALPLVKCWNMRERWPNAILEDPADQPRFLFSLKDEEWSGRLARQFKARFGLPNRHDLPSLLGRLEFRGLKEDVTLL